MDALLIRCVAGNCACSMHSERNGWVRTGRCTLYKVHVHIFKAAVSELPVGCTYKYLPPRISSVQDGQCRRPSWIRRNDTAR